MHQSGAARSTIGVAVFTIIRGQTTPGAGRRHVAVVD
jgi:hypothetical protein